MFLITVGIFASTMLCACLGMNFIAVIEIINDKYKKTVKYLFLLAGSILSVFIISTFIELSSESYQVQVALINVEKEILKIGIDSEKLSETENTYLIIQAHELNEQISQLQFMAEQWYGYFLPDEVHELTLIEFK